MDALSRLSVDHQVALLFVGLFGVLVIATLAAFFGSLRIETPRQQAAQKRVSRSLRAVWVGATLFWVSWAAGPLVSTVLFGLVSFVALREFVTLTHTRRADHRSLLLAFFVVLPAQYLLAGLRFFDAFTVFIPVYVFFAIPVVSALANDPHRFLERTAKIQWGIAVCVYGMSHAPALLLLDLPGYGDRGAFLVLFFAVVVTAGQLAEEIAARRFRRRPVARAISRWFSWRAFGAGVGGGALVGAALVWSTPFSLVGAATMGAVAAGTGSLGAFVMHALKRDAGVRSWSGRPSVTGAVGLLDRVAPYCFAAPVFFHGARWTFA